jgi:hypothetical protein
MLLIDWKSNRYIHHNTTCLPTHIFYIHLPNLLNRPSYRQRAKACAVAYITRAVSDRLRTSNFRSWSRKTFLANAFAVVRLAAVQESVRVKTWKWKRYRYAILSVNHSRQNTEKAANLNLSFIMMELLYRPSPAGVYCKIS